MHSQNVEKYGIKGMTSKWGGGPPGRGGPRSSERMFWDICGNPAYSAIQGTTDSMDGFGGPPVATYEQGGEIEFIVVVNGEHGGIHQFRLCDKKVGNALGIKGQMWNASTSTLLVKCARPGQGVD